MSGSPTTVKQTTKRLGPSMRFVADLSELGHSLMNLTLGQSGQVVVARTTAISGKNTTRATASRGLSRKSKEAL